MVWHLAKRIVQEDRWPLDGAARCGSAFGPASSGTPVAVPELVQLGVDLHPAVGGNLGGAMKARTPTSKEITDQSDDCEITRADQSDFGLLDSEVHHKSSQEWEHHESRMKT